MIEKILNGEKKALRQFYTDQKPRLYRYIINKVNSPEDAEEIMQDVFLQSIDAMRNFTFKSTLKTFIVSITNHKIIDFYRKRKIKNVVFSKLPPNVMPLISNLLGPEEEFNAIEMRLNIKEVFSKIKPNYSNILKLKYIEGFSVIEIAQKLFVSNKSVESILFRARAAFIKEYKLLYAR